MTKEQIIDSFLDDAQRHGSKSITWDQIKGMMEEYAKQQAIAFGIWIHKEGWVQSSDNLVTDNLWYHEDNDETYLTTQQLHDLFIEHQKQNNQ
jgi:hypothetical protein